MLEIETVNYEQCRYDWSHISGIYPNIASEPEESDLWHVLESDGNEDIIYRKRGGYFQFLSGDNESSLWGEVMTLNPLCTDDDAEWIIEKHGTHEYLVRTAFTETFGPTEEIAKLDEVLTPYGLWLEDRGQFVWGAATFADLASEELLQACERLILLERWCMASNKMVKDVINGYWKGIREQLEPQIIKVGASVLILQRESAKHREPLPLSQESAEDAIRNEL